MALRKKRVAPEGPRVLMLETDAIEPNPGQPRQSFDPGALSELAESIALYGVLQPLTVRRGERGYQLIAGERRLRASKLAGLSLVPCVVLEVDGEESSLIALVENLQRRDLDFLEEAEGLSRLIQGFGMSQEEAAQKIGKSQSAVANKLRLLRLSPELLSRVREAQLSERHARALLRLESDGERQRALSEIIRRGLNVAKTDEYIDSLLTPKQKPQSRGRPRYIIKDVRLFLNSLNRGVDIMHRSGIAAQCQRQETESEIVLTVRIPKPQTGVGG